MRAGSGAATRGRIIRAVADRMARDGFRGLSLDEVLRLAGVTKGAFYHHFPTKRDLGRVVLREVVGPDSLSLWQPVADRSEDPIPAILDVLNRLEGEADGPGLRSGFCLSLLASDVALVDEALREDVASILRERSDLVAAALERGREVGTVRRSTHVREAADFLLAALDGIRATGRASRDPDTYRASLRALRLLVQTLRPGVALRTG